MPTTIPEPPRPVTRTLPCHQTPPHNRPATASRMSSKAVLQSSWKIAEQINELRCIQGTGHGRTLPTGVTAEMALLMVREACSVADFALTTLDRLYGR